MAAFENLSGEEQRAIFTDYMEVNQTPGVTPGAELAPPETATTVRVRDGEGPASPTARSPRPRSSSAAST